jgi:hypothetical protein
MLTDNMEALCLGDLDVAASMTDGICVGNGFPEEYRLELLCLTRVNWKVNERAADIRLRLSCRSRTRTLFADWP